MDYKQALSCGELTLPEGEQGHYGMSERLCGGSLTTVAVPSPS